MNQHNDDILAVAWLMRSRLSSIITNLKSDDLERKDVVAAVQSILRLIQEISPAVGQEFLIEAPIKHEI